MLEGSNDTPDHDNGFTTWARLQLLTQEARHSLNQHVSESTVRIAEAHVNLSLAAFEKQLIAIMNKRASSSSTGKGYIVE